MISEEVSAGEKAFLNFKSHEKTANGLSGDVRC